MINDLLYKEIIERMNEFQLKLGYKTAGTEILLLSLMSIEDSMTNLILAELGIKTDDIIQVINESYYLREPSTYTYTLKQVFDNAYELQKNKDFVYDEAYLYSLLEQKNCTALEILSNFEIEGNQISDELLNALQYLEEDDKLLINLTQKAKSKELNKLIGRKNILETIDNVLSKKQKNNCMLIGPAGVGKSGIVEGLAYYYLKYKKNYTIYQLDIGSLVAGTKYRGDLEEKLMDVLENIKGKNNILFIDEIHNIMNNSTSENSVDIGNLLKPYLARSTIKCIGATTIDEYYKTIGKDKALSRRFKTILIKEPSYNETIQILNGIKKDYEKYYNISYSCEVIKKIVSSSRYFHNLNNPDKSIDIMDECGIYTQKKKQANVKVKTIKEVIYNGLGINIKKANHYLKNSDLTENIKKRIFMYLNLLIDLYICLIEINNEKKSYYVNQFKKIFSLNNENILEIDINDYNNEHMLSTLLGTSPGYVGYEDGGLLSKHILRNNISLVIFNNYEENKNNIFNKKIINKIINNGYLIDYQGNKINFNNTIILLNKRKETRIGLY